ncbi:MAG TPA: pirin family protein [Gammaproteobacteria bacterium]|nr:pirin family protein [Gammaproteobacteria bacterium]
MTTKTIKRLHAAYRDDIADLTTRRPVPGAEIEQVDPFLFLNHHGPQVYPPRNRGLPFGPHPHRGFETVTFILTGELAHRDSAGHESIIKEGGIQWMTAGSGLVHAEISPEEFKRAGGPLEILQLWVNLPPKLKMTAPRYVGLQRDEIPAIATPDGKGTVHLVSGRWNGRDGAMQPLYDVFLCWTDLAAGGRVAFEGAAGRNVFLYVVRGSIKIAGAQAPHYQLVELSDDGDTVDIEAETDTVLLVGHAPPIGAPVVSYGPFVMNTRDEIVQAIRDYEAGKFNAIPAGRVA